VRTVLDAGALSAIDHRDRDVVALIKLARRLGGDLVTVAPVVGQAWRNGARQAELARALQFIDVAAVDVALAKGAGELMAKSQTSDVVDALLSLAARPGDHILTSDPSDMATLMESRSVNAVIVKV
jgi:hypothetical protein